MPEPSRRLRIDALSHADRLWRDEDIAAVLQTAPPEIALALKLAVVTKPLLVSNANLLSICRRKGLPGYRSKVDAYCKSMHAARRLLALMALEKVIEMKKLTGTRR